LLVQALHEPLPVEKQVAVLYCGTHGLLANVPLTKVQDFQKEFLMVLELSHQADVLDVLKKGILTDEVSAIIEKVAGEVAKRVTV
jgi:F-type H+-transporting ATPase subunit alpha